VGKEVTRRTGEADALKLIAAKLVRDGSLVGATGAKGDSGPPGLRGAEGRDGEEGRAGAVGATGPPGPQGPPGELPKILIETAGRLRQGGGFPFAKPGANKVAVGDPTTGMWELRDYSVSGGATGATGPAGATGAGGAAGSIGATGATGAGSSAKFSQTIGDGTSVSFTITHNLGTRDVHVQVYETATPFSQVTPDIRYTTTNTVTVIFLSAPSTNQYRVVVIG